jgi:FMN phosphatase YigB (HAD superfamily)
MNGDLMLGTYQDILVIDDQTDPATRHGLADHRGITLLPKIRAAFFWFGGVLTPGIPELAARLLFSAPIETLDVQTRLRVRQLTADLCVGQLTGREFCQSVIRESGVSRMPEELEAGVKKTIHLREDVVGVIAALPDDVERWLICDFPRDWYESAASQAGLSGYFSVNRVVFTAECRLTRLAPNIFYHVIHCAGHPMDACLMIDESTPRSVEAIRHGLHAAIFVDAAAEAVCAAADGAAPPGSSTPPTG